MMSKYANLGMMKQSYLNMMCGCLEDITALLLSRSSVPIIGLWNCRQGKDANNYNNIDSLTPEPVLPRQPLVA